MTTSRVLKKEVSRQFLRFCLIGVASTILNYLIFLMFYLFITSSYLFSAAIGFLSGVFFGFIFNKLYTFNSDKEITKTLPKYLAVYLFSLIFNLAFLELFVMSGLNPIFSNFLLAIPIIIINFFGTKIIAFQNKKW